MVFQSVTQNEPQSEKVMEKRLGRGLGSLLGGAREVEAKPDESQVRSGPLELELGRIVTNPFQPRTEFDSAAIDELAASIENHGILQPVVVRRRADGGFELIAGERRLRASRKLGLDKIPAIVRDKVSDRDMLELALVENVQRQALNPLEKALAFKEMLDTLSLNQEQVADKVGLRRSTVANHLRLLSLPDAAQDAVRRGLISMGHAKALVGLAETEVLAHLQTIVRDGLSVRDIEGLVRKEAGREVEGSLSAVEPGDEPKAPWVADIESRMREALGTKVTIKNGEGYQGQIVVEYYNRGDLDRMIEKLTDSGAIA